MTEGERLGGRARIAGSYSQPLATVTGLEAAMANIHNAVEPTSLANTFCRLTILHQPLGLVLHADFPLLEWHSVLASRVQHIGLAPGHSFPHGTHPA